MAVADVKLSAADSDLGLPPAYEEKEMGPASPRPAEQLSNPDGGGNASPAAVMQPAASTGGAVMVMGAPAPAVMVAADGTPVQVQYVMGGAGGVGVMAGGAVSAGGGVVMTSGEAVPIVTSNVVLTPAPAVHDPNAGYQPPATFVAVAPAPSAPPAASAESQPLLGDGSSSS